MDMLTKNGRLLDEIAKVFQRSLIAFVVAYLLTLPFLKRVRATAANFQMMDLSQLYTLLFCLWFLVLGAIEYFVLRFIWRRWFSLAD